jgi:hypothetical protein
MGLCLVLSTLALLAVPAERCGAEIVFNMNAAATTLTMPDAVTIPAWGFALNSTVVDGGAPIPGDGIVTVPGPVLVVPTDQTVVTVKLTNNLTEPVSLQILGQQLSNNTGPVWTVGLTNTIAATQARPEGNFRARVRSFSHETPPGGTGIYTWTGFKPGTFLLQSGTNPAKQVQMGLFAPVKKDMTSGGAGVPAEAYTGVPYDKELLLVFHEVDPVIQGAIAAGTYGFVPGATVGSSISRTPKYFLINGKAFPDPALRPVNAGNRINAGERVLVRFLNGGLETYVPQLQGLYMKVWAEDGNLYKYPRENYGNELPPTKTIDAVITPASGRLPFYDARLNLSNAGSPLGGMMGVIVVQ